MAFNYARAADTAARLLAQFGQAVTLTRTVAGGYDPATGVTSPDVTQTQVATAVMLEASQGVVQSFDVRFESGTLIESNLRSVIIAAEGLAWAPKPADKLVVAGETWTVIGMTPTNPAGVPVIYRVTVKR